MMTNNNLGFVVNSLQTPTSTISLQAFNKPIRDLCHGADSVTTTYFLLPTFALVNRKLNIACISAKHSFRHPHGGSDHGVGYHNSLYRHLNSSLQNTVVTGLCNQDIAQATQTFYIQEN